MESRLGIGVELENDANVGALGEKAFGAAHDVNDFVYIRLSAGSARADPGRASIPWLRRGGRRDRPRAL